MVAKEQKVITSIVEKDYWLMHCLWGLQQQNIQFELKGGTSLSKGFGLIDRFSEDVDIKIHPEEIDIKTGKNHDNPAHVKSRKIFFDTLINKLNITGFHFHRDHAFDDVKKMRSAGIRAEYQSLFNSSPEIKNGVLLELGFDQTTPNLPKDISSWVFNKAKILNLAVIDNRAKQVPCYCPEYTFVEKLQTISTKYRLHQSNQTLPVNFLRHYYDIYKLLENDRVLTFIGTEAYQAHKQKRFRTSDETCIANNPAFTIPNNQLRTQYAREFQRKPAIYFHQQPDFLEILSRIEQFLERL